MSSENETRTGPRAKARRREEEQQMATMSPVQAALEYAETTCTRPTICLILKQYQRNKVLRLYSSPTMQILAAEVRRLRAKVERLSWHNEVLQGAGVNPPAAERRARK